MLVYVPALFWRFTVTPGLSSDLSFIMDELDRSYNSAIKLAKCLHGNPANQEAQGYTRSSSHTHHTLTLKALITTAVNKGISIYCNGAQMLA